eukprot:Skav208972  [mRNA]  locus=scaffold1039:314:6244:+ [translate_table: standard]
MIVCFILAILVVVAGFYVPAVTDGLKIFFEVLDAEPKNMSSRSSSRITSKALAPAPKKKAEPAEPPKPELPKLQQDVRAMLRFETVLRRAHRSLKPCVKQCTAMAGRRKATMAETSSIVSQTFTPLMMETKSKAPARSNWEEWMVNLRGEEAWLASPRELSWYTGKAPLPGVCPGVSEDGSLHALPMPNLDKAKWLCYAVLCCAHVECLFAGFKGEEPFYRPPVHGQRPSDRDAKGFGNHHVIE